ncbi:hypothetical protein HDU89_001740 [Geranomyces variabilis]|nr:hypothetical protein HDU89_001740 [Geranomyces variabilis]
MAAARISRQFGSASSLSGSISSLAASSALSRDRSRDRLDAARKGGGLVAAKKKMGSLGNLVGKRDSTAVGQLRPRAPAVKESSEVYSVKFSLDDEYIAVGLGDAQISILSTRTNERLHTLTPANLSADLPCTSIAFRPEAPSYKNKNVLAAAYASGDIIHWHTTSNQEISRISEGENQPYVVTYNTTGSQFATGGSDCAVRLYDGEGMRPIATMKNGTGGLAAETAGHSNRIFAVKFHPTDTNCLISAGWDNTVQIWDPRVARSVRSFYGPHICGDALDFLPGTATEGLNGSLLVCGSYRKNDALQIWSFAEGALVETIPWTHADNPDPQMSLLYSVGASASGKYIVAAGGSSAQFKVFSTTSKRPVGMVTNLPGTIYSAAMSHDEKMVAFGGSDLGVWTYDIDPIGLTDFMY